MHSRGEVIRVFGSMIDFSHPCGGPEWSPDLFGADGRLTRLCKGGGGGAAIKEQKKARKESARQFKIQMEYMRRQAELAAQVQTPRYNPAAPPSSGSMDVVEAGRDYKRAASRRFGAAQTVLAGERAKPVLGGGARLSA